MFDASEILFLDRAVELHFLTPSQRGRLLAFQSDLQPGMSATSLVVEAGLMSEDEVGAVLNAIAEGSHRPKGGSMIRTAPGRSKAASEVSISHTTTSGPVVNRFGVAMSPKDLDDILGDGPDEDDAAKEIAKAISGMLGSGKSETAAPSEPERSSASSEAPAIPSLGEGWAISDDPYAGWMADDQGNWVQDPSANWVQDAAGNWVVAVPVAPQQAFPLPGGGNQAFPMPGGGNPRAGESDGANESAPLSWGDERPTGRRHSEQHEREIAPPPLAKKLSASMNEIDELLVE